MPSPNLPSEIENRKSEHLRVCIEEDVEFQQLTNGLEKYRFTHCCLPELDRSDIELGTTFLGKSLKAPILISSMTGGTELAHLVNTRLATGISADLCSPFSGARYSPVSEFRGCTVKLRLRFRRLFKIGGIIRS